MQLHLHIKNFGILLTYVYAIVTCILDAFVELLRVSQSVTATFSFWFALRYFRFLTVYYSQWATEIYFVHAQGYEWVIIWSLHDTGGLQWR